MKPLKCMAMACALLGLMVGCASANIDQGSADGARIAGVDVDTPRLRALKQRAGIADCQPGSASMAAPVDALPKVALPCLGGGPDVRLDRLRGPMVINLWAQWCGPCRDELPYYQRLHEAADGRLRVLGIDYQDTQPEAALRLLQESGVTYPSLADPAAKLRAPFRVGGLPVVVLVGPDGRVRKIQPVAITSYRQLRDLVAEHLDTRL